MGMLRFALPLVLLAAVGCATTQNNSKSKTPLRPAIEVQSVTNAVTTTADGRAFVGFPKPDGGGGASVVETKPDGSFYAFPDAAWNSWKIGDDAKAKFVRINSLRIGPDGQLWLIDVGSPAMDTATVPGGPKLISIDLRSNKVSRVIPLDDVTKANSFLDDFRFNVTNVYITDAGAPALIVLDLATGKARRVLENHPSTVSREMFADGKKLTKPDGSDLKIHADQIEVSPEGNWCYYQPASGPMSKIDTRLLDDPGVTDAQRAAGVQSFYNTPTTGGTAIDGEGNLYVSDVNTRSLIRISPRGEAKTLLTDNKLIWGDALWIDSIGTLWIPAAQLQLTAGMNKGVSAVKYPVTIYTWPLKLRAIRN